MILFPLNAAVSFNLKNVPSICSIEGVCVRVCLRKGSL